MFAVRNVLNSTNDISFKLEDHLFKPVTASTFQDEFELPLPLAQEPRQDKPEITNIGSTIAQIRLKGRKTVGTKEELFVPRYRPEIKQIAQLLKDYGFSPISEKAKKGTLQL